MGRRVSLILALRPQILGVMLNTKLPKAKRSKHRGQCSSTTSVNTTLRLEEYHQQQQALSIKVRQQLSMQTILRYLSALTRSSAILMVGNLEQLIWLRNTQGRDSYQFNRPKANNFCLEALKEFIIIQLRINSIIVVMVRL